MSDEPKTLTPGELLAIAHEHDWSAHFHDDGYVEIESLGGDDLAYEGGLLDALCAATSKVLGVPVVARDEANKHVLSHWEEIYKKSWEEARDEAAELRAENKKLHAWIDELALAPDSRDEANALRAAVREYREARDWYRHAWGTPDENEAHGRLAAADEALQRIADDTSEPTSEPTPPLPNALLLLADAVAETIEQAMWGQTLSGKADLDGRDKVTALLEQVRRLAGGENEK